jgi:hypothetical protein
MVCSFRCSIIATFQGLVFRYCVPMDNARPSLDLANFDKVCPDKDIKGTSKFHFLKPGQSMRVLISAVPVIAVFTKYDQFRRETIFRLEDQGVDTSTDPARLDAEIEKIFNEQYLAKLTGSAPVVHLESENFVNQLVCTTLIPVPPAEMHKPGRKCTELIEKTANELSSGVVALMLLAVQKDNLELNINQAVRR